MATGTGTPGSNQDGPVQAPNFSPGEIVTIAGPLSINASIPVVDMSWSNTMVTKAYDLAVHNALRPRLIMDQFATVRSTQETHQGAQTLSSQTWPFMSAGLKSCAALPTTGRLNVGAALPMKGDGTSRGLRNSPLAKKPTNTTKKTSGSHRFIAQAPCAICPALARALAPMR